MEALYKMKKPKSGQNDRTMRAKLKDTASKSSRANLLDSKRRIPLSEVQSSNKVPEQDVKKEKSAMSRAERLVEWKRQREEAKAKQRENDKKNPPFRCGGKRPTIKTAPVRSPVVAKAAPPAAVKKSAPSTSSGAASSTSTQAKKATKKPNIGPSRSSARLAAKKPASTSGAQKSATATRKNTNAPEPAKPRSKAQQPTGSKKTASTAKPPVNRGQSSTSGVKGAASTKAPARKLPSKTQENSNERRVTTRSVAPKASTKKTSSEVNKGTASKIKTSRKTAAKETDNDMPVDPPTTPKKGSYTPIHPSPLLKRQVAPVRRETVYVPQFVNEPAWIPGAQPSMNFTSSDPNFDEAFESTFSPFRFTAEPQQWDKFSPTPSQQLPAQQQQFVLELKSPLKLSYDNSSSSLSEKELTDTELSQSVVSPPARKRRRSSRRCSRRLEAIAPLVVNVQSLEESGEIKSEEACSTESQVEEGTTTGSEEGVDIGYFLGLHAQVTEKFTRLCQEWEEKSNKLEQEYADDNGTFAEDINVEDVLGQIRTTVCQAQLLMRKKLKQYISLVEEAQDPTIEKRANADDLQSFWDMVYFQVEDVQKKFDAIETLEKNGWKHKAPTLARKRTKKATKAATKKAASSEETSERLQAARDKRQAQRNRLKEMRLAAKRAREQEAEMEADQQPTTGGENTTECQEEALPATPSPKKNKLTRTPKVSSSGRRRRCSQRLLARSVFSPIECTRSENIRVHEIPVGSLVSLS